MLTRFPLILSLYHLSCVFCVYIYIYIKKKKHQAHARCKPCHTGDRSFFFLDGRCQARVEPLSADGRGEGGGRGAAAGLQQDARGGGRAFTRGMRSARWVRANRSRCLGARGRQTLCGRGGPKLGARGAGDTVLSPEQPWWPTRGLPRCLPPLPAQTTHPAALVSVSPGPAAFLLGLRGLQVSPEGPEVPPPLSPCHPSAGRSRCSSRSTNTSGGCLGRLGAPGTRGCGFVLSWNRLYL